MATHHFEGTPTGHEGHAHHALPLGVYIGVYLALLVLTYLTVQVSFWNLGPLSLLAAMFVALIKAGFVVGFFMHLRYDDRFLSLVFFCSLFFIAVFFAFTLFDLTARGQLDADRDNFRPLLEQAKLESPELGHQSLALTAHDAIEARKALHKKAQEAQKPTTPSAKPTEPVFQAPADLLAIGKEKFSQLCALCHGPKGLGDGAGAAGLKVKPSAFGRGEFRISGGTFDGIMKTLKDGSLANGMAAYGWMPEKERQGLTHYILYLAHHGKPKKAQTTTTPPVRAAAPAKPAYVAPPAAVLSLGQEKFSQLCALCHGPKGLGDGMGAAGLKVKPSAFGRGEFRVSGGTFDGIMKILKDGSLANGMAAYGWMPEKEREALSRYILHLAHLGTQK